MKIYILLTLILVAALTLGCVQQGDKSTIEVTGTSELSYEPDEAQVWVGVTSLKDSANEAQTEVNSIVNAVLAGLEEENFDNIQTERVSLYEEKEWSQEGSTSVGWRATQTIKVKTKDTTKLGTIIDIATSNGANQIQNINFGLSETLEQEYKQLALAEATKNAKEKAQTIAQSLDARLGKIMSVSEGHFNYVPYRYELKAGEAMDMVEEAAVILPQEVQVTANINLIYEVN